ncbi:hypothetical protein CCP4SC76_6790002 [Gammaproteobacteria bacterium]
MGSPPEEAECFGDERQHSVTIKDFEIAKTLVTQSQWRLVMGTSPSEFQDRGDDCPVENVSWDDVQKFILKLNARVGRGYRLPTEAEWEYAGRGGRVGELYCGGNDLDAVAWHGGNSGGRTHPVGHKVPNGYGLYDMSGNVWEWTSSAYDEGYGGAEQIGQTIGPTRHVIRGGSWASAPGFLRVAYRNLDAPDDRRGSLGFRLARG